MWISGTGDVMTAEERNVDFLKSIVRRIYATLLRTEYLVSESFPDIKPVLPTEITFIHSEELRQMYFGQNSEKSASEFCASAQSRVYYGYWR